MGLIDRGEGKERERAYRLLRRYALADLVRGGYGFVSFLRVLAWLFKVSFFAFFLFHVKSGRTDRFPSSQRRPVYGYTSGYISS